MCFLIHLYLSLLKINTNELKSIEFLFKSKLLLVYILIDMENQLIDTHQRWLPSLLNWNISFSMSLKRCLKKASSACEAAMSTLSIIYMYLYFPEIFGNKWKYTLKKIKSCTWNILFCSWNYFVCLRNYFF